MKNDELIKDEFERELQKLTPSPASEELIQRLENSLDRAAPTDAPGNESNLSSVSKVGFWAWSISRLTESFRLVAVAGTATVMVVIGAWYFNGRTQDDGGEKAAGSAIPSPVKQGLGLKKEDTFQPFEVENRLVDAADDGIVGTIGDVPFRRVRYQLIDSYTWKNDADGASITMAVPREEILIIPVSTY